MTELDREINLALNEGVSNENNLPFLLKPEQPTGLGVLLVHGFSSSPNEMRPLGERLAELGHTVLAVRLPGHGTSPEDLSGRSYEEWLAATERGRQLLCAEGLTVVGIGLSTGALLLLKLAASKPFAGLVLLSPYLQLRHRLAPLAGLLRHWRPYHERPLAEEDQPYYYSRRPLQGVHQINRLRRRVKRLLPEVSASSLVLATEGDQTIAPGTAHDLFQRLGSREKKFRLFGKESPHVLIAADSPCREEAFAGIEEFLSDLPADIK